MMDLNWETVLLALIASGFFTVMISGFKSTWLEWFKLKLNIHATKANLLMKSRIDVYDVLNELKNAVDSPRTLVLYTEDGGGLPKPGSPLYITILYEATDKEVTSIKHDIQHILTDESYDMMLSTLITDAIFISKTTDLSSGILRQFYEMDEINSTIVVPILQTKKRFYYLSVAFKAEHSYEELTSLTLRVVLAANKLKSLLEKS